MELSIRQKAEGVPAPRIKAKRQTIWILFMLPALLVYTIFMAVPLLNSMRLSLFTGSGLTPERFVGLDNYARLLGDPIWRDSWLNALGHTWIFFGTHMLVQNTLGMLFAVLLSSQIRGREIYKSIIFAPVTLSTLVIGFLWYLILHPRWGALNKLLVSIGLQALALPWLANPQIAMIVISLVSSWQWVGIPTMLFMAGLLGIPSEVIEAAQVDGASDWQVFWQVKLPLLMPVIGVVSILTFVNNFNAFDIVYAMAGAQGEPHYATDILGTYFYRTAIAGEHPVARPDMGMGASVATITFLILLAGVVIWLYFSRRRQFEL
jgi:raffinose/stachyose/melibiose transport system permease protein